MHLFLNFASGRTLPTHRNVYEGLNAGKCIWRLKCSKMYMKALGRRQKKTVKKRSGWLLGLTPLPQSGQENVKFSDFYFRLYILIIYDLKRILPQKNIFWPLTPPCSPTHPPKSHLETFHDIHGFSCLGTVKRASKMHFSASSQWSKICFGY